MSFVLINIIIQDIFFIANLLLKNELTKLFLSAKLVLVKILALFLIEC